MFWDGQAAKEAGGPRTRAPKAVILAPTRELACQVEREIKATAPSLQLLCCYGGVAISNHERELRRGVDIVVGTPGRMIDLMKRGALDLSEVEFSILDEADQMLSVGFEEDVELLYGQMPDGRTNYLFSATMPVWVKKLARNYLTDPVTVDLIGDSKVPSPPIFTLSIRPKPNRATPWHSPFPFPAHSIHTLPLTYIPCGLETDVCITCGPDPSQLRESSHLLAD